MKISVPSGSGKSRRRLPPAPPMEAGSSGWRAAAPQWAVWAAAAIRLGFASPRGPEEASRLTGPVLPQLSLDAPKFWSFGVAEERFTKPCLKTRESFSGPILITMRASLCSWARYHPFRSAGCGFPVGRLGRPMRDHCLCRGPLEALHLSRGPGNPRKSGQTLS